MLTLPCLEILALCFQLHSIMLNYYTNNPQSLQLRGLAWWQEGGGMVLRTLLANMELRTLACHLLSPVHGPGFEDYSIHMIIGGL